MARRGYELHHVLHHRNLWTGNLDNKWLREKSGLIVPMDIATHDELHENTCGVPPLDIFTARRVSSIMQRRLGSNAIRNTENFMQAVTEAGKHPKSHEIERQLGELVVQAVELQMPYLKSGIVEV